MIPFFILSQIYKNNVENVFNMEKNNKCFLIKSTY